MNAEPTFLLAILSVALGIGTVQFARDVERADANKGWQEGFEKNAAGALAALKERIDALPC
jgi:hypothetical protein